MQVEVEVGSRQVLQVVSIYQRLNQHRHPNLGWNQKNPRKYVSFWYELHINYSFYFCTAKQHFLAVTDEQGTLRVLEIPKNLRVASRGEVSLVKFSVVQHCLKQDRSLCCLSESRVMACMYSKRQTCRLPFFLCLQSIYMERYFRLEENVLKDFLLKQELWEKEKKPEAPSPEATVRRFGNIELALCWHWLDGVGKSTVNIGNKKKILTMSYAFL